jgi:DNA-directed RNA polymerase subunit RPC12/RpoP
MKRDFRLLRLKPSKKEIPQLAMLVVACGLVFYVVGIATDLFGPAVFSVVTYAALGVAAAASVSALILGIVKVRKVAPPKPSSDPVFKTARASNDAPARTFASVYWKRSSDQSTEASEVEATTEPEIETLTAKQEVVFETRGKIVCSECKKQFSTPLFMLEYTNSKPKLVRHCPYCNHLLET